MKNNESGNKRGIYWFRKCLRLHDNPALVKAMDECDYVYPIFILDPWFKDTAKVGVNRWKFLWESLHDLNLGLKDLNSKLLFLEGKPTEVFQSKINEWNITNIYFEGDTEPYSKIRDQSIVELSKTMNVSVQIEWSHTLFNPNELYKKLTNIPKTYQSFLKAIQKYGKPPNPLTKINTNFKTLDLNCEDFNLPNLNDFLRVDFSQAGAKCIGGETEALRRMDFALKDNNWICSFDKPKTSPNSLEPSTTTLSPYLKFGCLSVRLMYSKINEIYKTGEHTEPPSSLLGQLLWREFFYFVGSFTKNFDKINGNPICIKIDWDDNEAYFEAWKNAKTGYPFIDAIMTQLRQEGWIHHLARHAVACFLTRGDLYCSWESGKDVFEELLLDADYFLNAANWQWVSASAFFTQYFRIYSPTSFGKKTDPNGKYIKKYLPILKDYPKKYIYEPWTAPIDIQEKSKCIIGEDYPFPIVDHSKKSKENIQRMKNAYSKR